MRRDVLIMHLTRQDDCPVVFQVGDGVQMPVDRVFHDPASDHIVLGISPEKLLAVLDEFVTIQRAADPRAEMLSVLEDLAETKKRPPRRMTAFK